LDLHQQELIRFLGTLIIFSFLAIKPPANFLAGNLTAFVSKVGNYSDTNWGIILKLLEELF
jgi:hypothetical protein